MIETISCASVKEVWLSQSTGGIARPLRLDSPETSPVTAENPKNGF